MKTIDFDFYLPKDLIAKHPCTNRSDARMLVYQKKNNIQEHKHIFDLPEYFKAGDLIVLNNTKSCGSVDREERNPQPQHNGGTPAQPSQTDNSTREQSCSITLPALELFL